MKKPEKQKIIFCQGIPGSGKSTWAKAFVADEQKTGERWVRINRDDIRSMMIAGWNKKREGVIRSARNGLIVAALRDGYNVIVDDTNFGSTVWKIIDHINQTLPGFAYDYQIKRFDCTLSDALRRNAARRNPVPEGRIRDMHRQYVIGDRVRPIYREERMGLDTAIICDIDGTLAIMHAERTPYDHSSANLDKPNWAVIRLVRVMNTECDVILCSGREDKWRELTVDWLKLYGVPYKILHMRPTGDKTPDDQLKKMIFEREIEPHYNIRFVLDDRNRVVDMWRDLRLPVFQVNYGDF